MKKAQHSVLLLSFMVATSAIISQPKLAHACLTMPCPFYGTEIPVNFGNTLVYFSDRGECTFHTRDRRVIQKLTSCRSTWHSIVYSANKLLFYDRNAGDIEIYAVGSQGLGDRLQNYRGGARRTWSRITSPSQGVISFRDDNGQVENYRLTNSGSLQRL